MRDNGLLNTEQKTAAEHKGGPLLVLAGPGTGKTTALVGRYSHLVESGVNPGHILCCTFSKKAADELKRRIKIAAKVEANALPIGTFHSLSLRILRSIGATVGIKSDFTIWAADWERRKVVEQIQKELEPTKIYEDVDLDDQDPAIVLEFIDAAREALDDPEDSSVKASQKGMAPEIAHAEVYRKYETYLDDNNKIDFPRMVQWACKALRADSAQGGSFAAQYAHVLVDEYQDINFAQKTLIDLLVSGGGNLWAVGDDYQAIYGWRGSDIRYILNFKKQYSNASVVNLVQNYRSGSDIIELANSLAGHFKERYEKDLICTRQQAGSVIVEHTHDENNETIAIIEEIDDQIKSGVPYREIAVLARTNKLPLTLVGALIQKGYPLQLRGGVEAFKEYECRLLLTAVATASNTPLEGIWKLRMSPALFGFSKKLSDEKWDRKVKALSTYISKRPPGGIDQDAKEHREETLERLRDYLLKYDGAEMFFPALKAIMSAKDDDDAIFVGTIHSAKGLEWSSVIVMGLNDGILPQRQSVGLRAYEEERRIAYVGITRAKDLLMLSYTSVRDDRAYGVSPFIDEMLSSTPQQNIKEQKPSIEIIAPPLRANDNFADKEFKHPLPKIETFKSDLNSPEKRARIRERFAQERLEMNRQEMEMRSNIADGLGSGDGVWQGNDEGLLSWEGYNATKDGPEKKEREAILLNVFKGQVDIPESFSETLIQQWGNPSTKERLSKIRNTINVALGTQKGRQTPSIQAIEKWESDLRFIDNVLSEGLK